jgi:hypothetical protein
MQQKMQLNEWVCRVRRGLLLQPVAPVALGALYAAFSDEGQCKVLATKALFATGFLHNLLQLKDDKPTCFTLCACWACVASVQLHGTTPEIKACSIYQAKVLKGILNYVCTTSLDRVRTESYLQALHPVSLELYNQSSYIVSVLCCCLRDVHRTSMPQTSCSGVCAAWVHAC